MKKTLLAAVSICIFISTNLAAQTKPKLSIDALNPRLIIVDSKQIVVNQEPIYFAKRLKNVRVTWYAPAGSAYRFDKDGIVIDNAADEFVDCRPAKDGKSFSCLNKHSKPGKYKYTVTLQGKPAVAPLDPILVND
ncbi:MAG: hypothetical protein HC782_05610 [Gammaproteobacteria bacterium]|nr:hypothetical protein [Gammaproteobacteria bacterium]